MRPLFLDSPQRHTRARRQLQSDADYGCAITHYKRTRSTWGVVGIVVLAILGFLILAFVPQGGVL